MPMPGKRDTMRIVDSLAGYDFCGFELDYKTDMAHAKNLGIAKIPVVSKIEHCSRFDLEACAENSTGAS
jgi:hypothetical protein